MRSHGRLDVSACSPLSGRIIFAERGTTHRTVRPSGSALFLETDFLETESRRPAGSRMPGTRRDPGFERAARQNTSDWRRSALPQSPAPRAPRPEPRAQSPAPRAQSPVFRPLEPASEATNRKATNPRRKAPPETAPGKHVRQPKRPAERRAYQDSRAPRSSWVCSSTGSVSWSKVPSRER